MIKSKQTVIDGLKRISSGMCNTPLEDHPDWDVDYNPLGLIWDAIDYIEESNKIILNIVHDVLHSGYSFDTVADQDYVYAVIERRIKDLNN